MFVIKEMVKTLKPPTYYESMFSHDKLSQRSLGAYAYSIFNFKLYRTKLLEILKRKLTVPGMQFKILKH